MGLSGAQAAAVQKAWAVVAADLTNLGTEFLVMFLNKHGYQSMFPALKDIPAGSMSTDQRVKDHATKIMTEWGQIIACCGDAGALDKMLKDNAHVHTSRKVTVVHYNNMFTDLFGFMQSKLGGAFGADAQEGLKALTAIMSATLGANV